ncbi:MAG: phage tail sheath family protein, partial [Burkholderiales bacterium]|nr:phage tail sheath family protein [Burkholderiales bacterium]
LALNTEWTYISIRRLFIYVEQSLKQSLQWVVFEPNDQTTWSSVTRDVTAFLTTLWQQGGLFGATAQEAFFVTCDASNNPPNTRMLGQMFIDIGLAPVYPAEFVILRMSQKTAAPDSGG